MANKKKNDFRWPELSCLGLLALWRRICIWTQSDGEDGGGCGHEAHNAAVDWMYVQGKFLAYVTTGLIHNAWSFVHSQVFCKSHHSVAGAHYPYWHTGETGAGKVGYAWHASPRSVHWLFATERNIQIATNALDFRACASKTTHM